MSNLKNHVWNRFDLFACFSRNSYTHTLSLFKLRTDNWSFDFFISILKIHTDLTNQQSVRLSVRMKVSSNMKQKKKEIRRFNRCLIDQVGKRYSFFEFSNCIVFLHWTWNDNKNDNISRAMPLSCGQKCNLEILGLNVTNISTKFQCAK